MEYLLKAGLLMTLLPVIFIKMLSLLEMDIRFKFQQVIILTLLTGVTLLVVSFTYFIITF